jgi:single-strand DNA-binding protein
MAQGDVMVTVVGNLTGDPELRFTQSGAAVVNCTVVKNNRRKNQQTQQWEDAGSDFYRVNAWRDLAENIANSLEKGARVVVAGKLESRDWETREGEKRTSWEITADAVGPDLRWATAKVQRAERQQRQQGQQQGQQQGGYQQPQGQDLGYQQPPQQGYQQPPADPWDQGVPAQQQRPPQQQQPQQGAFGGDPSADPWMSQQEPPF